ncbi:MAG: hypothetical protein F7B17_04595 [Desulfurococcales archaeon]|nr:hypothetical protein [Desulfurococcales archaeon]
MSVLRGLLSTLLSLVGFAFLLISLAVLGSMVTGGLWSEVSKAGLLALVIAPIILIAMLALFAVGNVLVISGVLMGSRVARMVSLPSALIDGVYTLLFALITFSALREGNLGVALISLVITLIVGSTSLFLARKTLRP